MGNAANVVGLGISLFTGTALFPSINTHPRRDTRPRQVQLKCEKSSSGSLRYNNINKSKMESRSPSPVPKVGVAVFLMKGRKLLLGRRLTSIAQDTFFLPGGHLEFGSSIDPNKAKELKSSLKFLVPFSPTQLAPESQTRLFCRGLSSTLTDLIGNQKCNEENEFIWWPQAPVMELARLAINFGGDSEALPSASTDDVAGG